jgi:hypothetical protein
MKHTELIPHQINLTLDQVKKLGSGLTTTLRHSQMGADKGDIVVMLNPQQARKMLTSYKRNKGLRLKLSPPELEATMKLGSGFFEVLEKIGISKERLKEVGKTALKSLGKEVVKKGADYLSKRMPVGEYQDRMSQLINDEVNSLGRKIIDEEDISASVPQLKSAAKRFGYMALRNEVGRLGENDEKIANSWIDKAEKTFGTGMKKGSPEMREKMARLRAMRKGSQEGEGIGRFFKKAGKTIKGAAKGVYKVGKIASKNKMVRGIAKGVAKRVIREAAPIALESLGALAGPEGAVLGRMAGKELGNQLTSGMGIGVKHSKAYAGAMKRNMGVSMDKKVARNQAVGSFARNPRVKASSEEMTLSPYARMDSPAMNPFIPTKYTQEGGQSQGYGGAGLYGGRGLYAGRGLF